ncbi:MAG: N-acetyltransferase [Ignavibacteria bacterium]|nr:N-acetyltransferase [Ignavibacteria bacterium]
MVTGGRGKGTGGRKRIRIVKTIRTMSTIHSEAFIHPAGIVEPGAAIGARTRVWAFAHVLGGARIGEDCNVCDQTFIENDVVIGDRVTVKCGVYLWDGLEVEDDVFIGPAAVFTNDLRPRSQRYPAEFLRTRLEKGCSIGAGAVLLPGITIGRHAMVAAASVVTRDVRPYALVVGNPARERGWVCACGARLQDTDSGRFSCACGKQYVTAPEGLEERA